MTPFRHPHGLFNRRGHQSRHRQPTETAINQCRDRPLLRKNLRASKVTGLADRTTALRVPETAPDHSAH